MKQINVYPIFDQSAPSVWSDFVNIKYSALRYSYGFEFPAENRADNIEWLKSAWNNGVPHFAFAAYDNDKMVGYIRGGMNAHFATIHDLYVLPGYMKQGVASRLLASAEKAASIVTHDIQVMALKGAASFYQLLGYSLLSVADSVYKKSLWGYIGPDIVPVFWCTDKIAKQCQEIASDCKFGCKFDASDVNEKHLPMFVRLDSTDGLIGYMVGKYGTPDNPGFHTKQICGNLSAEDVRRMMLRIKQQKTR